MVSGRPGRLHPIFGPIRHESDVHLLYRGQIRRYFAVPVVNVRFQWFTCKVDLAVCEIVVVRDPSPSIKVGGFREGGEMPLGPPKSGFEKLLQACWQLRSHLSF